jgi:hypothetical protein
MKKKGLLSQESLKSLKELEQSAHATLGDVLYAKVCKAVPELRTEQLGREKGILWWILHNQLEVLGRAERCKDLLLQVIDQAIRPAPETENAIYRLGAALDHLKQNLTFLVGELSSAPEDSYYVLDRFLGSNALSAKDASKYQAELLNSVIIESESTKIKKQLKKMNHILQRNAGDTALYATTIRTIDEMLSAIDIYYAEIDAFYNCKARPAIVFFHFRRVEAAGMRLLAAVIMAETVIELLKALKALER